MIRREGPYRRAKQVSVRPGRASPLRRAAQAPGRFDKPRRRPPVAKEERPPPPAWKRQRWALKAKFPEGWMPTKKLSPDAQEGIRTLARQYPALYTASTLAKHFEMSPEAIRRILRADWDPTPLEEEDRRARWFRRGVRVWSRYADTGMKPPVKWREEGIKRRTKSELREIRLRAMRARPGPPQSISDVVREVQERARLAQEAALDERGQTKLG